MRIVWDENKNQSNKEKHKVSFEIARLVFEDPFHLSILERIENSEERWQTMGMVGNVVVLLVAHTSIERDGRRLSDLGKIYYENGKSVHIPGNS